MPYSRFCRAEARRCIRPWQSWRGWVGLAEAERKNGAVGIATEITTKATFSGPSCGSPCRVLREALNSAPTTLAQWAS